MYILCPGLIDYYLVITLKMVYFEKNAPKKKRYHLMLRRLALTNWMLKTNSAKTTTKPPKKTLQDTDGWITHGEG